MRMNLCTKCDIKPRFTSTKPLRLVCCCKKCGERKNIFKKTILENQKTELANLFKVTYLLCENVKLKTMAWINEISYQSLKKLVIKYKEYMKGNFEKYPGKIGDKV